MSFFTADDLQGELHVRHELELGKSGVQRRQVAASEAVSGSAIRRSSLEMGRSGALRGFEGDEEKPYLSVDRERDTAGSKASAPRHLCYLSRKLRGLAEAASLREEC